MSVRTDVLAALPVSGPGLRRRDVQAKIGMWANATIGRILADLISEGACIATGPAGDRLYSRAPSE